ncbi:MAG: pyridoxal phosphate-dependent aminotransferase [Planctomycetia bacterium]|nr:pyridoxal phosphate-dependent aminotransferase [Planctomycetia bacterium]
MAFPVCLTRLLIQAGLARYLPHWQRLADGGSAFLECYSDRLLSGLHTPVADLLSLQQCAASDLIDLATPVPAWDFLPSCSTKLPADRRGMPSPAGLPELQQAVADKLSADHELAWQPTGEVLITAGVSGAFNLVLDALLNPGGRVVLFAPAAPLYQFAVAQRRGRIRWVPTWIEDGFIRYDPRRLIDRLRHSRLIVLNAPANPTGGLFRPEDLEQIAWWAHRFDTLIFSDDVAHDCCDELRPASIAALPRARERTLLAGSPSKSHALTAARVGWLAGHRCLLRPCLLSTVLQSQAVPVLSQQLALTALRLGAEVSRPMHAELASRRRYSFERLHGMGLRPEWPAGGHWHWVPVSGFGLDGQQFADQLAADRKVLVWPGRHFGPGGEDHIRISFAGDEGRLRLGLQRLADFVGRRQAAEPTEVRKRAA